MLIVTLVLGFNIMYIIVMFNLSSNKNTLVSRFGLTKFGSVLVRFDSLRVELFADPYLHHKNLAKRT